MKILLYYYYLITCNIVVLKWPMVAHCRPITGNWLAICKPCPSSWRVVYI